MNMGKIKDKIVEGVEKIYKKEIKDRGGVSGVPLRRWVRYAPRYDDEHFVDLDTDQFFRLGNGPIKHVAQAMGWTEENVQNWMFKAEDGKTKGRIPELKRLRNYYLSYEQEKRKGEADKIETELRKIDKLDAVLYDRIFISTPYSVISNALDIDSVDVSHGELGVAMLGAATFGIQEWLRLALSTGIELPMDDFPDGISLLHRAASYGNSECVSLLLQHGAEVDARDDDGETPIMTAVYDGHVRTTEILLENGASIKGKTAMGLSLWEMASDEIEAMLDEHEESRDETSNITLKDIIDNDLYKEIHDYYEKESLTEITDGRGYNPLHISAEVGNVESVKYFIDSGVNPNIRAEEDGFTPLHLAAREGNHEVIHILSEAGADVDVGANRDITPLLLAANNAESNRAEAYFALIEQGANPAKVFSSGVSDSAKGRLGTLMSMFRAAFPETSEERRETIIEAVKAIETKLNEAEDLSDIRSCVHEILEIGRGYKVYHLTNILIQFVEKNYEKDIGSESDATSFKAYYDTSGHYKYVNLNGSERIVKIAVESLKYNGINCVRYGESHKPASNGKNYDWYVRVETDNGDSPSLGTVKKALSSLQSANIEFTFDSLKGLSSTNNSEFKSARSKNLDDLKSQVAKLREKVNELKQELRETKRARDQEEIAHAAEKSDLLSQNSALREKIAEVREDQLEGGEQEKVISSLKNELNKTRERLEQQREEFEEYREVLKYEKKALEEDINGMEKEITSLRNKKEIFKSELEEKKLDMEVLKKENKRLRQYAKNKKDSRISEPELENIIDFLFPNIKIKRSSISFLANEVIDPSSALEKLYKLSVNPSSLNGSRIRGAEKKWMEVHYNNGQSDAGRIYYRKTEGEKRYKVVISHKSTQKRDIKNLN